MPPPPDHAMHHPNVLAFLQTIAHAEGTATAPDPYRICFGYRHTIRDLRDHPAITGEWRGEKLPDHQCKAAGHKAGCVSTAAGKYQNIRPTWLGLKTRLKLPDFGPASQDAAAIQLLQDRGAYAHLLHGDLVKAVAAARKEWASLPGAGYQQPERSFTWLQAIYTRAGGTFA
ncbi:glycoside hydrolase family 24 protein [Hydrogenophaga sp.]|uniref:glycoside hydrolase family 24 protein n=1 Tax=Hydrogenophaga sp. TaxID=1904254 RepID=UPI003F6EAC56